MKTKVILTLTNIDTVKESFSRLSMPSRSKDPNDTQRTYQHFYGGEKNPKLLADETNE